MYRSNQDYYRGKVRSVYEKEPMFREFVRNIPLSEMNFYENRNLSVLKQRFNTMVQARHGMDAASKRFLWTVIKRRTSHCCTVLTTHSMEECEALCGRIGVMVDGALRCLGPIQSLKSKYGSGYKLDLRLLTEVADEAAAQPLVSSLQAQFAGTQLEELEPPSMVLTVPSATAQLSQLFAAL